MQEGADSGDEPFAVYAFNWTILSIFWATWHQWKKIVIGTKIIRDAIDWTQVESALNLSKIKRAEWPHIFEGLRAAQDAALEHLNHE